MFCQKSSLKDSSLAILRPKDIPRLISHIESIKETIDYCIICGLQGELSGNMPSLNIKNISVYCCGCFLEGAIEIFPDKCVVIGDISVYLLIDANKALPDCDIDILVSEKWPLGLTSTELILPLDQLSKAVLTWAQKLRPRFLVSSGQQIFYKHTPLQVDGRILQFISLDDFHGLKPGSSVLDFNEQVTPSAMNIESLQRGFSSNSLLKRQRTEGKQENSIPKTRPCFLCMSNPAFESHLVLAIATEAYLVLAKGPLPFRGWNPKFPFSGHVIIAPMEHVPSIARLSCETRDAFLLERRKFISALTAMFEDYDAGLISFTISTNRSVHLSTQIIPVPKAFVQDDSLVDNMLKKFEQKGFSGLTLESSTGNGYQEAAEFLEICLPDKRVLWSRLDTKKRFDHSLPRTVLAELLGIGDRRMWNHCIEDASTENNEAQEFRDKFGDYDFTL